MQGTRWANKTVDSAVQMRSMPDTRPLRVSFGLSNTSLAMSDFKKFFQKQDLGLLILRLMMGVILIGHGVLHMMGKNGGLESFGRTLQAVGIHSAPFTWGIIMSVVEIMVGGCLLIGFYMRLAVFLGLLITVPSFMSALKAGASFAALIDSHFFRDLVLLPMLFMGAGAYSYDKT